MIRMYTSGTSGRGSIFITILGRDIRAEVKRRCASADYTDAGGVPHPPGRERIGSIVSSADPPHGNAGNVGTGIVSPIDACVSVGVRPTRHTGTCGAAPRVPTRLRARGITPHALGMMPCRVRRARCHPVHHQAPTSALSHAACMRRSQRAMPSQPSHACMGPNGPCRMHATVPTGHRAPSQAVGGATPYTWMMAAIASVERESAVSGPYQPRPTGKEQSPSPREAPRSEYGVMVATWACRSHLMGEAIRGHQRPPETTRGHQRPPEAIGRRSEALGGNQWALSEASTHGR